MRANDFLHDKYDVSMASIMINSIAILIDNSKQLQLFTRPQTINVSPN